MACMFWITCLFIITIAGLLYYFVHLKRQTDAETDEHFLGTEMPMMSTFVAVGVPAEVVEQTKPAGGNDAVYFKEQITAKEIESAVKLATTAEMQDKWGDMFEVSRKTASASKDAVVKQLEDALAVIIDSTSPRFKVRGAQVLRAASPNGNTEPIFYSRWDVMVHRENKQYGYAFEPTFLHIDDQVHLCAVEHIVAIGEDSVETITALPGAAGGSSLKLD